MGVNVGLWGVGMWAECVGGNWVGGVWVRIVGRLFVIGRVRLRVFTVLT